MTMLDPLFDETDLDVEAYYCPHGTFTGNPHGADYLCGPCEDGISLEDWRRAQSFAENRRIRRATAIAFFEASYRPPSAGPIPGHVELVVAIVVAMARWAR